MEQTMPDYTWIDSREQLPQVIDAIAAAPWVALDSEANSMFVYRERVCLLQLNAGGRFFLIDTLALLGRDPVPSNALDGLKPALEDRHLPKLLHGGEYDVGILKRDFDIHLAGVWDSQQAATFLGWERTGYGAVVEKTCGVSLEKAYSQYDWGTRPLDPKALVYALDDVVYLPQVWEQMKALVRQADLEEELSVAFSALEGSSWSGGFDPAAIWRMQGARDLPASAMGLLAAVHQWRDSVAREMDRPSGMLINDRVLVSLVSHKPKDLAGLKRAGLRASLASTHGEMLLEALQRAATCPPVLPPEPERRGVTPQERARDGRLRDWRREEAKRRKVPPQVVLPPRALDYLKRFGAGDLGVVPQLGEKRARLYGEQLRKLCGTDAAK
jgi:ribonuclease D